MRVSEARDISAVFQRSKKVLFEVPRATIPGVPSVRYDVATLLIPYSYVVRTDGDKKLNTKKVNVRYN